MADLDPVDRWGLSCSSVVAGLEFVKLGVEAAAGGALVVGADFDGLSVAEHDDETAMWTVERCDTRTVMVPCRDAKVRALSACWRNRASRRGWIALVASSSVVSGASVRIMAQPMASFCH